MARAMWLVFVTVSIVLASMVMVYSGVKIIESFESFEGVAENSEQSQGVSFVQHGMCDCCKCGVIDCKKCAESGKKCCTKFSRLTFSETPYGK